MSEQRRCYGNNGVELTEAEVRAVSALQRVARRWPPSLTLFADGGSLIIIRTEDVGLFVDNRSEGERDGCIVTTVHGIPNDGGAP